MDRLKVGIIDSGIDTNNKVLMRFVRKGIYISNNGCENITFNDELGHGTAIADLITRDQNPDDVELYIYKTFAQNDNMDIETLKKSLTSALEDKVDILNCSFGTIDPTAQYELEETVNKLIKRGVVLVCSWNDEDYTTWPANFPGVLSIKGGTQKSQTEWIWEDNKRNHLIFRGTKQRVKWSDGKQLFISGSSFATALCTRTIVNVLLNDKLNLDYSSIQNYLKEHASDKIIVDLERSPIIKWNEFPYKVKKIGIYPFYKEAHSFIRFRKELPYEIEWVADFTRSKNYGKVTNEVMENCEEAISINKGLSENPGNVDTIVIQQYRQRWLV